MIWLFFLLMLFGTGTPPGTIDSVIPTWGQWLFYILFVPVFTVVGMGELAEKEVHPIIFLLAIPVHIILGAGAALLLMAGFCKLILIDALC